MSGRSAQASPTEYCHAWLSGAAEGMLSSMVAMVCQDWAVVVVAHNCPALPVCMLTGLCMQSLRLR